MKRTWIACALLTLVVAAPTAAAQQGSIVASGTGTVELAPDQASLTLAVETAASAADAAAADNAELVHQVRAALTAAGVAASDISTAHYNIRTNWRRQDGDRVADGYVAISTLRVEVRDIDAVGGAIDAALTGGANRVDGVQFRSSRADEARREAVALAVADAMGTANAMAAAAGGQLDTLIELTTEGLSRPVMEMQPMAAQRSFNAPAPTPIRPGALTVTARVIGRWSYSDS